MSMIHAPKPHFAAPHIKAPKVMTHIARPPKIHPAASARIRLPQGVANTSDAAPAPYLPNVGKI